MTAVSYVRRTPWGHPMDPAGPLAGLCGTGGSRADQGVRRTIPWILIALAALPLAAQDTGREQDHDALRRLRAVYEDAVNNNDLSKVKPLLAEGFTGVMISGEELKSYEDLVAFWSKIRGMLGAGGKYRVKVVTDQTDFFGDLGISRGYTEEQFVTAGGKEYNVQARWTAVTRKQNGEWKLFRVQGSIDPIDNPAVEMVVSRTKLMFAAAGMAAGLLLAVLASVLLRRRHVTLPSGA
jgi:ketosteroid isomerase-like protein